MPPKKPSFEEQRERCKKIIDVHSDRDRMYREMRQMLFMEWDEGKQAEAEHSWVRATMSPDPYNAIMGVVRLLVSTDPTISVMADETDTASVDDADKLEKVLGALWKRTNRRRRWPVHYDAVLSAALFSEVAIQIGCTADTLKWAKDQHRDTAHLMRYARDVPFTMDVVNPATVYPEFGAFGLRSVTRSYIRKAWQVRDFWGKLAHDTGLTEEDYPDYTDVTYNEFTDETNRCVWVTQCKEPILYDAHGWPFINWVVGIATGSGLFEEPHRQRFPMLYPVWKGKWWHRQNRLYTQIYTVTDLLANPHWLITTDREDFPSFDLSTPGGTTLLGPGESVEPLALKLIDESVKTGVDLAESKMVASTVPHIVFGESPGATMSYSAMNLLTQGGRLPLVPIEKQVANVLSEVFETVLAWIHHNGKAVELYGEGRLARVEAADINPAHIEVEVKLKADVPQDKLQLANVVKMLREATGPDGQPLISARTALEFLEFMQPQDEQRKIMEELFDKINMQQWIQSKMVPQAQGPAAGQPPPQQTPPTSGGPFDGVEEGVPPVMVAGSQPPEGTVPRAFPGE